MATVAWSGYWNDVTTDGRPALVGDNLKKQVSKVFRHRGTLKLKEVILTDIGQEPGDAAYAAYNRVSAVAGIDGTTGASVDLGGDRPMETVVVINRVTTDADDTEVKAIVNRDYTFTRVADRSGNGAGGQAGY